MAADSLSDADHAYMRFVRFGELPERVRPDDLVELIETDPRRDRPEPAGSEEQSRALRAGG